MALSEQAKSLACQLVDAWDKDIIAARFELIDCTRGNARDIQLCAGTGIHEPGRFPLPTLGVFGELAEYENPAPIRMMEGQTSQGNRKWTVQLTADLRDLVARDFTAKPVSNPLLPVYRRFFVSYKRENAPLTQELETYLNRVFGPGSVWYDNDLRGGQVWWEEIVRQIGNQDVFIYLLSPQSLASLYCRNEFTEAIRLNKQVIPIELENGNYPDVLTCLQYIKAHEGLTTSSMVEVFAAIIRPFLPPTPLPDDSLWVKRSVRAQSDGRITVNVRIPANVEPTTDQRAWCNTGILVTAGDRLTIASSGQVSVDTGTTWMYPDGAFKNKVTGVLRVYPSSDAYSAANKDPGVGNKGVVGSLFGWIAEGNDDVMGGAFCVGERHDMLADRQGFLYLAANDNRGDYDDNQGEFEVTVELSHPASAQ